MLPLKDINPTEKKPVVTISIIIACTLVYFHESSLSEPALRNLIYNFGFVPARFFSPDTGILEKMLPVFTSMFLHGSFLHIAGNMLYLWIFGNNVEDRLGHIPFLIFYFLSGTVAALAQGIVNVNSNVPMIGASGAIAGVLGAYLVLFPGARIVTLIIFYFITVQELPSYIVISLWFIIQFFNSLWSLAGIETGVAYLAHVGGFVAGLVLVNFFPKRKTRRVYYPKDYY